MTANMSSIEYSFQEFVDAIQTARGDDDFERVETRVTQRLGFRWFAYLRLVEDAPKQISSYPKSWTSRYFDLHYEQLDPVVRRLPALKSKNADLATIDDDLFMVGEPGSPHGLESQFAAEARPPTRHSPLG